MIIQFTPEEAEWYGYSFLEAIDIIRETKQAETEAGIIPWKHQYRRKLIDELIASGLTKVERVVKTDMGEYTEIPVE